MTGNLPITIINLFFVPMISMMICYKKKNKEYKFNEEFFVPYSIYCVFISTFTKFFVVIIREWLSVDISVDSSYYTAIAIVVAFALPYTVEILQKNIEIKYSIISKEESSTDEKTQKKEK